MDADDWLIVDKPPGLPVHGGPTDLPHDVVRRLSAWLASSGRDPYLGVHQRLDQEASGVLAFTRRPAANRVAREGLRDRTLARTYLAVVQGRVVPDGLLEDRLETLEGRSRVVSRGGKVAGARCRTLQRHGEAALVEVRLETGRTHQIRVQLATRGAPIVGDVAYGGPPASRLMLHASCLAVPGLAGPVEAPVPPEFDVERREREPLDADAVGRRVADALAFRWPLARHHVAYRWVDGEADGLPGVSLDAFGDAVIVATPPPIRGLVERAVELCGGRVADEAVLEEGSARLVVDASAGGARVDPRARGARAELSRVAPSASVLVVGAGRGAFTATAATSGASSTITLDARAGALRRVGLSLDANGVRGPHHRLLQGDVLKTLARLGRHGERFDVVALDGLPRRGVVERVGAAATLAARAGTLVVLAACPRDELHRVVRRAARELGREPAVVRALPRELDDRAPGGGASVVILKLA